jgi:hypothetical protein
MSLLKMVKQKKRDGAPEPKSASYEALFSPSLFRKLFTRTHISAVRALYWRHVVPPLLHFFLSVRAIV